MFYGDTVQSTRGLFFSSWGAYRRQQALLPLEQQIVDVILIHPEYHALLEANVREHDKTYFPELGQTNPFLHMGFHLAIRDQVATDRPSGITAIYQQLISQYRDRSIVEHLLMEHFADCLWQAQRHHTLPDEIDYLLRCRQLLLFE